jgi:hypothetical protein
MATEADLRELLTTYESGVYVIDTLTISHSQLSKTYYLTLEPDGITIDSQLYEAANFSAALNTEKSDLDEMYTFTIQDIDNVLDDELDLIDLDTTENISCVYKAWLSDDIGTGAVPARTESLDVLDVSQKLGAFTISCGYKRLNFRRTGVEMDYNLFPMLRAL